jgi:hypothetical protein
MAVPKKKRYKQIVRARRSLFIDFLLRKKNLKITKFINFKMFSHNSDSNNMFIKVCSNNFIDCGNHENSLSNKVCNFCSNFNYFFN